jgi:hypothetical protein
MGRVLRRAEFARVRRSPWPRAEVAFVVHVLLPHLLIAAPLRSPALCGVRACYRNGETVADRTEAGGPTAKAMWQFGWPNSPEPFALRSI